MTTKHYDEFPIPLSNLPRPGYPVTDLSVCDTVFPLLHGIYGCLVALSEAHAHAGVDPMEAHHATGLLASQVDLVRHILTRWHDEHLLAEVLDNHPRLPKTKKERTPETTD